MGKGGSGSPQASDHWATIDSSVAEFVGKRVFFNHAEFGKSIAFIIKPSEGVAPDSLLAVLTPTGVEVISAPHNSGRDIGSWDTAQPGDTVS